MFAFFYMVKMIDCIYFPYLIYINVRASDSNRYSCRNDVDCLAIEANVAASFLSLAKLWIIWICISLSRLCSVHKSGESEHMRKKDRGGLCVLKRKPASAGLTFKNSKIGISEEDCTQCEYLFIFSIFDVKLHIFGFATLYQTE